MKTLDYRKIFYALPHNYFIIDIDNPKFTILDGSDQHINGLGFTREQLIGQGVFEMFPNEKGNGESSSKLKESFERVMFTKMPHMLMLQYDVPINGTFQFRFWNIINTPYFEDGVLHSIINQSADITPVFQMGTFPAVTRL